MIEQLFMSNETKFIHAVVNGIGFNYDDKTYDWMRWRDIIYTTIIYIVIGIFIYLTEYILYFVLIYLLHLIYLRYGENELVYKTNKHMRQEIIAYHPHYSKLNNPQDVKKYTEKLDFETQANIFSIITQKN